MPKDPQGGVLHQATGKLPYTLGYCAALSWKGSFGVVRFSGLGDLHDWL